MSLIPTNFSQGNNIIRLLYPMIIGYIISYQCKMNKSDGSIAKFRPPPIVFGIVWPILYILIGLTLQSRPEDQKRQSQEKPENLDIRCACACA